MDITSRTEEKIKGLLVFALPLKKDMAPWQGVGRSYVGIADATMMPLQSFSVDETVFA